MQEFSMVGGYMENLEKPQNCQNWGVGACLGMGACSGQYGSTQNYHHYHFVIEKSMCEIPTKMCLDQTMTKRKHHVTRKTASLLASQYDMQQCRILNTYSKTCQVYLNLLCYSSVLA